MSTNQFGTNQLTARRRPLRAGGRRVRQQPPNRLLGRGTCGHGNRVEQSAVILVHIGLRRVDDLGRKRGDMLLDDTVHLDVGKRVEPHVGQVEMHVVVDSELAGSPPRLLFLLRALRGIARVLRRAAVGDADDPHRVAADRCVERDRPAHPEHLVVRMRREDEHARSLADLCRPMSVEGCGEPGGSPRSREEGGIWGKHCFPHEREPKVSVASSEPRSDARVPPAAVSISSSTSAPRRTRPRALPGARRRSSRRVPTRRAPTGRARQTTTFSSREM